MKVNTHRALLTLLAITANPATAQSTSCFSGNLTEAGSDTVLPLATTWKSGYNVPCPSPPSIITVEAGGSGAGAGRVCALTSKGTPVDIGAMSRGWKSSEASPLSGTPWLYQCLIGDTTRVAAQLAVASDGVTVIFKRANTAPTKPTPSKPTPSKPTVSKPTPSKPTVSKPTPSKPTPSKPTPSKPTSTASPSIAQQCIELLGGLTKDQLRWMFSNYTAAVLTSKGWDSSSLPNSDGNDATHLWSELNPACASTEILIAGPSSTQGTFDFFKEVVLTDGANGEGYRAAYAPQDSNDLIVSYVTSSPAAVAFVALSGYLKSTTVGAASIKNSAGVYVAPSLDTVKDGSYNPLTRLVYMNLYKNCTSLSKSLPWLEYGYSSSGDTNTLAADLVPLNTTLKTTMTSRVSDLRSGCLTPTSPVKPTPSKPTAAKPTPTKPTKPTPSKPTSG